MWAIVAMLLATKLSDFYVIYNKQLSVRLRTRSQDLEYTTNNCENTDKVVAEGTVSECNTRKDRLQETPSIYALHDYMSMKKFCDEDGCKGNFINFTNRPLEMITIAVVIIVVVMVIALLFIFRTGQSATIPMMYAPAPLPQNQQLDQGMVKTFQEWINRPKKENDSFFDSPLAKKLV